MKISILTEGGSGIGFGHLTRCLALAQGFIATRPDIEVKLIINVDKYARDFLKIGRGIRQFTVLNWLKEADRALSIIEGSCAVIIDSYLAPKVFYRWVYNLAIKPYVAVLDDYDRLQYPADAIINPSVCGYEYKKRAGIEYLIGPDYVILRKEFCIPVKKIIRKKIRNGLITFGGIDYGELMSKVAVCLAKYKLELCIVNPREKSLSPQELRSLMLKADLCISAGGQTISELAHSGVPAIGICFSDNQLYNLKYWQKKGFIKYIGRHTQKDLLKNMDNAIFQLLPYRERVKMSMAGRRIIDGEGVSRIVDFILYKSIGDRLMLRPVKKEDFLDIWKWRNHAKVRRWSFNKHKINLVSHRVWFGKIMKDPQVKMYIALEKRQKVGVIRMDKTKDGVLVNVNLSPHFMGKGLGAELIKAGTLKYLKETGTRKPILAKILKENTASCRAFVKSGYKLSRKNKSHEYLAYVYN